ncbi:MAG: YggS family pyridoxal phosphate-dependent enzyme [Alphaproteobacteria bacterium]|nr:YggS family pyridoxal phosphate-dependent enzyme [Alphaproteobacteria bacterium]
MNDASTTQASSDEAVEVAANLEEINAKISAAARRADRPASDIALVAVSKVQPFERVEAACLAGHRLFGENRVQEAMERWPSLRARFPDLKLHLIGPLQTNKVADAVGFFDVIESLDRPKLAAALKREMDKQGVHRPCYIQVNTGEEPQKAGVMPLDADSFIARCRDEHGLDIAGLMCIPPQGEEPALHFALLREIALRNGVVSLSMGMSGDFETAIELGATHVRVGTAVFGARGTR